jgi:hypothetical protein
MDASTTDYKAVYVTISEVQVHVTADSWKVVASPNKTYNLIDLVNGVREQLGIAELDTGNYTEMRLILGEDSDGGINILSQRHPYANYVIAPDNTEHELKVPSGYQTGVKIVQGFTINANQTTELLVDFNASASVVVAGKSGKWLLKPTIKVLETPEYAIISGTVTTPPQSGESQPVPVPGVLVSAQISDSSLEDPKDQVVIQASTVTDADGQYKLFIEPGTYTMIAYKSRYSLGAECPVTLIAGQVLEGQDFGLTLASTGSAFGAVFIDKAGTDQYATISFRQSIECNEDHIFETPIEVTSVNILNDGSYDVTLPVGDYELVASSYNKTTESLQVTISENVETEAPVDLF